MLYRSFGTTADVGVVSYGKTVEDAFENQAAGMFSIMADLRGVRAAEVFEVDVGAHDIEGLLAAWLEELLFLSETRGLFFRRSEILSMKGMKLRAKAYGEGIDPARHVIKSQVKAVTYHGIEVKRGAKGFTTRVVYDI